ncbi:TPA: hypothetical protein HA361_04750 [Candidatus Woesearchaeota archaeon]|nr:hypothetical protein [Candidatus Woesearchaeota archaeon]
MHYGIIVINFTEGKRRENSSVAFGKEAVGNDFWRNDLFFSGMMTTPRCKGAGNFIKVKYYFPP